MNHFLSFIISCYNRENTVKEAIDSIYQQNLSASFEVIVTDDCSTDSTKDVLSFYQRKHSNFYVSYHNENKGPAASRNNCVKYSKGNLIFSLDSDNFLEPNSVAALIKLLDKTKCDAAAFAAAKVFRKSNRICELRKPIVYNCGSVCDLKSFMHTSRIPPSQGNYLYTRKSFDQVGGYFEKEDARVLSDYRFGFRQLLVGVKIAILPNSFYWHRSSKDSNWSKNHALGINDKVMVNEFRKHLDLFTDETNKLLVSDELIKEGSFFKKLNRGQIKLK